MKGIQYQKLENRFRLFTKKYKDLKIYILGNLEILNLTHPQSLFYVREIDIRNMNLHLDHSYNDILIGLIFMQLP